MERGLAACVVSRQKKRPAPVHGAGQFRTRRKVPDSLTACGWSARRRQIRSVCSWAGVGGACVIASPNRLRPCAYSDRGEAYSTAIADRVGHQVEALSCAAAASSSSRALYCCMSLRGGRLTSGSRALTAAAMVLGVPTITRRPRSSVTRYVTYPRRGVHVQLIAQPGMSQVRRHTLRWSGSSRGSTPAAVSAAAVASRARDITRGSRFGFRPNRSAIVLCRFACEVAYNTLCPTRPVADCMLHADLHRQTKHRNPRPI